MRAVAMHVAAEIDAMGPFTVISDGSAIPVLAFRLKDTSRYTVFHVSDLLRSHGWQVPAYTMPEDATDVAVLRIVVREGFDRDLADSLLEDLRKAIDHLDAFPPLQPSETGHFAH